MPDQNNPKPSFIDSLSNLVGDIVSDARDKIVEEGWFGRSTTSQLPNYYESFWQRHGYPGEVSQERERGDDIDR